MSARPDGPGAHARAGDTSLPRDERTEALLAATSRVMQVTLRHVGGAEDLSEVVERLLLEITRNIDSAATQLFLYDPSDGTLAPSLGIDRQGLVRPGPGLMGGLPVGQPFDAHVTRAWPRLLAAQRPVHFDLERDADCFWPGTADWHRSQGHRGSLCVALVCGETPVGMLGISVQQRAAYSPAEVDLVAAVSHSLTLAIQMDRLAGQAREAALARERERTALARAELLERGNAALQRMVDAVAQLQTLDRFLPAMLEILADALRARTAGYFEQPEETIHLRFWLHEGRHLGPFDWPDLEEPQFAALRRMSEGFTVAREYLGVDVTDRASAQIVDHAHGPGEPDLHAFALSMGWRWEINAPLVVGDRSYGAVTVYRPEGDAFTLPELALAETLARMVSMALQAHRLAEREKEVALAEERERVALGRAALLERGNLAMQQTVDALARLHSLDAFIPTVLEIVTRAFDVESTGFFEHSRDTIWLRRWLYRGRHYGPMELPMITEPQLQVMREMAAGFSVPVQYLGVDFRRRTVAQRLDHRAKRHESRLHELAASLGWEHEVNVPLVIDGEAAGAMTLYRPYERPFTDAEVELAETLGKQVALAMQAYQLAGREREAAVARERQAAAELRAADLEASNAALDAAIQDLRLRDQLITAVARASKVLLGGGPAARNMAAALGLLGQTVRVQRAKVMLERLGGPGPDHHEVVHDWWAPGFEGHGSGATRFANAAFQGLFDAMRGGHAMWLTVDELPPEAAAPLASEGVRATCVVPLFVKSAYAGLVAFDELQVSRTWLPAEQDALIAASQAIGAALEREREAAERVAVMRNVNRVLAQTSARLSRATDLRAVIVETLRAAGDVLAPGGLPGLGLVLYDPATRSLVSEVQIQHGQEIDVTQGSLAGRWPVDSPALAGPWARAQREPWIWGPTSDPAILLPEVRAVHEGYGTRSVAYLPLRHGDDCIGFVGFSLASAEQPSTQQVELIQALGGQIALAIEMRRLAQASQQAALARQREEAARRRAAEVSHAHEVLRRTAGRLNSLSDHGEFLATLAQECSDATQAACVYLLQLLSPSRRLVLRARVWRGAIRREPAPGEPAMYENGFDADITSAFAQLETTRDIVSIDPFENGELEPWPDNLAWHQQSGHRQLAIKVLHAGQETVGFLGFAFFSCEELHDAQRETVTSLAHQAALALRLEHLAQAAQQAALAREREASAQHRAAELEQAYAVLRRSIEQIAPGAPLDVLLDMLLLESTRAAEASGGAMLLWHAGTCLRVACVSEGGAIVPPARWEQEAFFREMADGAAGAGTGFGPELLAGPLVRVGLADVAAQWPARDEYGRRMGHAEAWHVPCMMRGELRAVILLWLRAPRAPDAQVLGTLTDISRQASLALEFTSLAEQAGQMAAVQAVADERGRLAADIHDSLAQNFSSIVMQSEALVAQMAPGAAERHTVQTIGRTARLGLAEARRSVQALRPLPPHEGALEEALADLAERSTARGGMACTFEHDGGPCALTPLQQEAVLRIAQEAVSNALRHSGGTRVTLQTARSIAGYALTVTDDGRGGATDAAAAAGTRRADSGYGLGGMALRAARAGGTLTIRSTPGAGTEVRLLFPATPPSSTRVQA